MGNYASNQKLAQRIHCQLPPLNPDSNPIKVGHLSCRATSSASSLAILGVPPLFTWLWNCYRTMYIKHFLTFQCLSKINTKLYDNELSNVNQTPFFFLESFNQTP